MLVNAGERYNTKQYFYDIITLLKKYLDLIEKKKYNT